MEYKPAYHHDIPNDLIHIPVNIKERIRRSIETRLLIDPVSYGLPLRKSLQGYRKLRIGDYRLIYRIECKQIIILKIGHRKDVYPKVLVRLSKSIKS